MNFLIFFFTILLQYLPSWVISSITPYGEYGDPPLFITDVMITKNEVECIYFYGNGMITDIFIQVYFEQFNEISSSASDLVLIVSTINNQTYEVIDCVMQGGYNNFIFPNCQYLEKWNSSWYAQSNVLVQDNLYAPFLSGNTWRLCMSNGWASSEEYVRYQSLIVMFGISYSGLANISSSVTLSPTLSPTISPTTSPTPISEFKNMTTITYPYYDLSEIISNCGESFTIKSEITLSGNEKSCLSFFGRGHIHTLHIILNYTLHSPLKDYPHDIYQGLSDFAITLINTQIWQGIQFGGGYFLDETIKEAILSWPEQFNNLYTSSNVIEIDLIIPDLSRYDISSGDDIDSPYQICLHNTYQSDSSLRVNYHSQANLKGITYQCNGHITTLSPTLVPTLSPTISLPSSIFSYSQSSNSLTLSISRLTLKSGSRECVELSIGGTLTSLIIRFTFQGNNINWVSDVLLSIEEMGVQCYQIEGLTASYNLHNCTFLSYWPNSLNQVANGFYEGVLDIKQPIILPDYTSRMICFTSTQDIGSKEIYYNGTILFQGLMLLPDPTSQPTTPPAPKSFIAPYFEDDAVLIGLICIPIIIVVFMLVMCKLYCHRKKEGVYKQIAIPDGNIFIIEEEDLEQPVSYLQSTVIDAHQHSFHSIKQQKNSIPSKNQSSSMRSMTTWLADISGMFYPTDRNRDMSDHDQEDSWHNQKLDQDDSIPVKTVTSSSISHRLQPLSQNIHIVPKSLSRTYDGSSPSHTPRINENIDEEEEDDDEVNRKLHQINRNMMLRSNSKPKGLTDIDDEVDQLEELKQSTSKSLTNNNKSDTMGPRSSPSSPLPKLKSLDQQRPIQKTSGGLFESFWSIFQGKRGSAISLQEMSSRPKAVPSSNNLEVSLDDNDEDTSLADDFISPNINYSPAKVPDREPPLSAPLEDQQKPSASPNAVKSQPHLSSEMSPQQDPDTMRSLSPPIRTSSTSPNFELAGMQRAKSTPSPPLHRSSGSLGSGDNLSGVWAEKIKAEKRLKSLSAPKTSPGEYDEEIQTPSPVTSPDWFDNDVVFSQEENEIKRGTIQQIRLEFDDDLDS